MVKTNKQKCVEEISLKHRLKFFKVDSKLALYVICYTETELIFFHFVI